jgi:hypothetical protein
MTPQVLAHLRVAPAALLLLAYLDPECRGDARYDFAWIAQWLNCLGIETRSIEKTTTSHVDFLRVQLGETVALALMCDADDRAVVDVLDLAAALYQYCFGEPLTRPRARSRRTAMHEYVAAFERRVMASFTSS